MSERMYVVIEHCDPDREYPGPRIYTHSNRPNVDLDHTITLAKELAEMATRAGRPLDTYEAYVLVPASQLSAEYGWAPDGDASDVRVPIVAPGVDVGPWTKRWARQCVTNSGGSVFVREATDWRQEP